MWLYGDYWPWGEKTHGLLVPYANMSEGPISKRYCVTDCPGAPLDYTGWRRIGWVLDTQVQLVGLPPFFFPLERPNGSTPNVTQPNMEWQTCIEPMTPEGEMQSPNPWTAREFPAIGFLFEPDPLLPMGVALGLWKPGWPLSTVFVVSGRSCLLHTWPRGWRGKGWTKTVKVVKGV